MTARACDDTELAAALLAEVLGQCLDIGRLVRIELNLIDMLVERDYERAAATALVQDRVDRALQESMFEFEHLRRTGCVLCAAEREVEAEAEADSR